MCVHVTAASLALSPFLAAPWPVLLVLGSILGVVAFTNFYNFMDGVNGIAASHAILAGFGAWWILKDVEALRWMADLSLLLSALMSGFLPMNFPKPRVFMGDVCSAFLGFWFAIVMVWAWRVEGTEAMAALALVNANFFLDPVITLFMRAQRGERLSQAHRSHFYQKLVRLCGSHVRVTLLFATLQIVSLLLVLGPLTRLPLAGILVVGIYLVAYLLIEMKSRTLPVDPGT